MSLDPVQYVTTYAKSEVGDPIIKAIPEEIASISTSMYLAGLAYWTACPYPFSQTISIEAITGSSYAQPFDPLLTADRKSVV